MFEQNVQKVQTKAKAVQSIPSRLYDGNKKHATFTKNQTNSNKQSETEATEAQNQTIKPSFMIEKQFKPSTLAAVRIIATFNKVLEYLERTPEQHREKNNPVKPKHIAPPPPITTTLNPQQNISVGANNPSVEEQLEFDIFAKEHAPNETPTVIPQQTTPRENETDKSQNKFRAAFGRKKPTTDGYQMHRKITDEIIKAIENTNKSINIKPINEKVADKIAAHVQKHLTKQPHTLTNNHQSASLKLFDKTL